MLTPAPIQRLFCGALLPCAHASLRRIENGPCRPALFPVLAIRLRSTRPPAIPNVKAQSCQSCQASPYQRRRCGTSASAALLPLLALIALPVASQRRESEKRCEDGRGQEKVVSNAHLLLLRVCD